MEVRREACEQARRISAKNRGGSQTRKGSTAAVLWNPSEYAVCSRKPCFIKRLRQPCLGYRSCFFATKPHSPYLQILAFSRLSRSPDSRIVRAHWPFRLSPMTGFRQTRTPPRIQWRYRPEFPPGSPFTRGAVTAFGALKQNIALRTTPELEIVH